MARSLEQANKQIAKLHQRIQAIEGGAEYELFRSTLLAITRMDPPNLEWIVQTAHDALESAGEL